MSIKHYALIALACLAVTASAADKADAAAAWTDDYKGALAEATKTGHMVLADFTGSDWCSWCKKLKTEVFDTAEFKEWAAKHVVLLEVDFPRAKPLSAAVKKQNDDLQAKFDIQGFPTVVFLDDAGKKIGDVGYVPGGPKAWIAAAESAVKGYKPKAH